MTEWFTRLKMWWHERRLDDSDEYLSEYSIEFADDDNERVIDMSRFVLDRDILRDTGSGETMTGREYLARITPPFPTLDKPPAPVSGAFATMLMSARNIGQTRVLTEIDLERGAYCRYQGRICKVVDREPHADWFSDGVYLTLRDYRYTEPRRIAWLEDDALPRVTHGC